jgi:hypothetical protein
VDISQVMAYLSEIEAIKSRVRSVAFSISKTASQSPYDAESWCKDDKSAQRQLIASLGYANIYAVNDEESSEIFVVKILEELLRPEEQADLLHSKSFQEIIISIGFNHPCVLGIVGWDLQDSHLIILMKLMKNGSLDQILEARRNKKPIPPWFDPTRIAVIVVGFCSRYAVYP